LLLEVLQGEITRAREKIEVEQLRLQREIAGALQALGEFASRADICFLGRVEELSAEVGRLREAMDVELSAIDQRHGHIESHLEGYAAQLERRVGEVQQDMRRLGETFDRQLEASEGALGALREATERRVMELREGHRRHLASVERSRGEVLQGARRSRDQFAERVEEVADMLEQQEWPAVPPADPPPALEEGDAAARSRGALSRWLAAWRGRFRRRAEERKAMALLQKRASVLEELLRERWEDNVRKGRSLRQALLQDRELFPAPADLAAAVSRREDAEEAIMGLQREAGRGLKRDLSAV
jgi:hypothetical protein